LSKSIIIIVSAPSGAGKSSIIRELVKRNEDITFAVSHTTREIRSNEENSKDYYFITKDKFNNMIENNHLIEFTKNFDNLYGTSKNEILRLINLKKSVICDIDENGHKNIINFANQNSITVIKIWIKVNKEEIIKRLQNRGDLVDQRILSIQDEYNQTEKNYDFIVENKDLETAILETESIIHSYIKKPL
jgi:guanylate kinase